MALGARGVHGQVRANGGAARGPRAALGSFSVHFAEELENLFFEMRPPARVGELLGVSWLTSFAAILKRPEPGLVGLVGAAGAAARDTYRYGNVAP